MVSYGVLRFLRVPLGPLEVFRVPYGSLAFLGLHKVVGFSGFPRVA